MLQLSSTNSVEGLNHFPFAIRLVAGLKERSTSRYPNGKGEVWWIRNGKSSLEEYRAKEGRPTLHHANRDTGKEGDVKAARAEVTE